MDSTINTQLNSSILDLSQRTLTSNASDNIIDHWTNTPSCAYTDEITDEEIRKIDAGEDWNINRPLTDQVRNTSMKEDSVSDSSSINKSKLELDQPRKKLP
jgi:hypothetical protein